MTEGSKEELLIDYGVEQRVGEACGLVGVYSDKPHKVTTAYIGMHALQHRGQNGAGMTVFGEDGSTFTVKNDGLVTEVISDRALNALKYNAYGPAVIGHDRYSTSGKSGKVGGHYLAQPFEATSNEFALGHNGHIEFIGKIARNLGYNVESCESDSEALTSLLDQVRIDNGEDLIKALHIVMPSVDGAASVVIAQKDRLIGARDLQGIRPLMVGKLKNEINGYVLASETVALDMMDADFVRDVEPGEIVWFDKEGMHSEKIVGMASEKFCLFEYIYFAHPNSNIKGRNVYQMREKLGRLLGKLYPIQADLVVGVQNSGAPFARGYAHQTGIPEELALTKNSYVNRTFIEDGHLNRQQSVELKHLPNRALVEGKEIILVDDSIVRGTTSKTIVSALKQFGASKVHFVVPSPPYMWPCYYGMDTRKTEDLIGHDKTVEEVRKHISADSLHYLSLDSVMTIVNKEYDQFNKVANNVGAFCTACMCGNYPTEGLPLNITKKPLMAQIRGH